MPTDNESGHLIFSFSQMEQEIVSMASISSSYLDDDAGGIIRAWKDQLKYFQTSPSGTTMPWQIHAQRPIRTVLSDGQYEIGGGGEHSVYGTISSIWDIAIPPSSGRASKRGFRHPHFALVGKASTRVSVYAQGQHGADQELARWRFEVGDSASPGCHFHAQVLGEDHDQLFPKSMSVPRLPNMLFTPMDALEFLLAELFQEIWAQHTARENDAVRNWAGCQRNRLIRLLKWQQVCLQGCSGSPWTSLKRQKPDSDLWIGAE